GEPPSGSIFSVYWPAMGRTQGHRWQFFRAGGVDQVSQRDASDLARLAELDQKLWVALAMPTTGVDVEAETLALLDHHQDRRIPVQDILYTLRCFQHETGRLCRVQDILDAIRWAKETLVDIGSLLTSSDEVSLAAIADPKVLATRHRRLSAR